MYNWRLVFVDVLFSCVDVVPLLLTPVCVCGYHTYSVVGPNGSSGSTQLLQSLQSMLDRFLQTVVEHLQNSALLVKCVWMRASNIGRTPPKASQKHTLILVWAIRQEQAKPNNVVIHQVMSLNSAKHFVHNIWVLIHDDRLNLEIDTRPLQPSRRPPHATTRRRVATIQ